MVVVSGSASSLLTSPVKVSARRGWAVLQAGSAAQALKRLLRPSRAFRQFAATVYVVGKTESRTTLRMPSGWSRMRVCAR
jgi:hypothetical protein